jgi:hypothetical protein
LKNCFGAVFKQGFNLSLSLSIAIPGEGFNKASIFLGETLHFKALTWIWLSKVNGPGAQINKCS